MSASFFKNQVAGFRRGAVRFENTEARARRLRRVAAPSAGSRPQMRSQRKAVTRESDGRRGDLLDFYRAESGQRGVESGDLSGTAIASAPLRASSSSGLPSRMYIVEVALSGAVSR